ncbi:IclR family transcriptional regulator [Achromobacter marplatensis]
MATRKTPMNRRVHAFPSSLPVDAPVPGLLDATDLSTDRQFANNLARGLDVLRAFTPNDPMLGNREIADRTGLPKPTVSRLTYTLTMLGYLSYVEAFHKYRLGSGVLSLGYPLLASMRIRQVARPFMEQISRETGCTVNLGMRDRLNVVYLDTCRVDQGNIYQPDIGSTRPLLPSSIGRALILGAPAAERQAILNRLKVDDPARFTVERTFLDADEKLFQTHGYCHSAGDWHKEVHAIAVPIRQPNRGDEGVAINCTMSAYRLRKDMLKREVAPRLLEAVLHIEQSCGLH